MTDHPGNPLYDGTATAARGVAESLATLIMVLEYVRRSRQFAEAADAHRKLEDATRHEMTQRRQDADRERGRRRDASQWHLGLEKGWLRTATVDEVVHVWAHTLPWIGEDVRAQQAKRFTEERLDRLAPDLMHRYRHHLGQGLDPLTAMTHARHHPPTPRQRNPTTVTPADQAELGPAPEPWEAGPPIAGTLAPAELLELAAPGPIPMGPTGWTDTDRTRRTNNPGDTDRVTAAARADLDDATRHNTAPSPRARRRIAAYSDTVTAEKRRSFHRSPAATDEHTTPAVPDDTRARARTRRR